jgi:hypothetical protein
MADYQEPEFACGIRISFPPEPVVSPEVIYRNVPPSCIYYDRESGQGRPAHIRGAGCDQGLPGRVPAVSGTASARSNRHTREC